jgi:hypothetical protein
MRQKKAKKKMRIKVLTGLVVVMAMLVGFYHIGDSAEAKDTQMLENVRILNIVDQKDTDYADVTFDDGTGQLYALVIHDVYIEKEKVFIGEVYDVEYVEHEFMRPDNLIQALID